MKPEQAEDLKRLAETFAACCIARAEIEANAKRELERANDMVATARADIGRYLEDILDAHPYRS